MDSLDLVCSDGPAGWLGYSPAVQVRSGTLCVKRPRWYLGEGWGSLVKSFIPEFPFSPRKLSVTKSRLETHVLNTTVWIFFFLLQIYDAKLTLIKLICLVSRARQIS